MFSDAMSRLIFVTGTNTDVGKTIVTRALVRALVLADCKVGVMKPVESGVPKVDNVLRPHDAIALQSAAQTSYPMENICRYMFQKAVSPHLAAREEEVEIDEAELLSFVKNGHVDCDVLVVEGAGGLLVPLNDQLLYADFVKQLQCELLIVAPDALGSINATLLTIEAARSRGISILGVVLNQSTGEQWGNADAIASFGKVSILGYFPVVENLDDDDILAHLAIKHLDKSILSKSTHT